MSAWNAELAEKNIRYEWNMYFPNLGHNICDSHAGHLKRFYFIEIIREVVITKLEINININY